MGWLSGLLALLFGRRPVPVPVPPPPPPPPPGPVSALDQVRADTVTAMNAARKAVGLWPLLETPAVDAVSQQWAAYMALTGGLNHGDFEGRMVAVFGQVPDAEDIAEGYPSAQAVVAGWMASPPHRANILGDYNLVGVGIAATPSGLLYWCADFALM